MAKRASGLTARIILSNGAELIVPEHLALQIGAGAQLPERYYVDIKEGSKLFCMCENTFRKMLRMGGIAAVDAAGKKLYSVKDICRYLEYCKEVCK